MASLDVRDVLNLPHDGVGGAPRPSKKQKTAAYVTGAAAGARNLKGLAREVQSLGGENPIAIVPRMLSSFKKRRLASRKPAARWEMRPFRNSARTDASFILHHWRRQQPQQAQQLQLQPQNQAIPENGELKTPSQDAVAATNDVALSGTATTQPNNSDTAALEDSGFAKFNVKVEVPQFTDDQYSAHLQNSDWTKEETDYLFELVQDFDLRWPLIWDRYDYHPHDEDSANDSTAAADAVALVPATSPSPRTMEDLKARYYEIAAKMMEVHKPAQYMTQAEYNLHSMMANFNAEKERLRKTFVSNALTRSREEVREEEALLLEVRRIMARVDRTNEERRELYSRLDFPIADQDISSFKTSAGLQSLLQTMMYNNEKSKKRKSLAAAGEAGAGGIGGTSSPGGSLAGALGGVGGAAAGFEGGRRGSINVAVGSGAHGRRESAGISGDGRGGGDVAMGTPTSGRGGTPGTGGAGSGSGGLGLGGAGGGKGGKKGGAGMERRKLTAQEQEVYGVSTHERLGSGPMFRYEKINKLFTHKSGQQQLRITNILNELDMPARLFMPTAAVTGQFEQLVNAVVQLVDLRKVSDKLDGEIKIEEQRKAERDKARAVLNGGQLDITPAAEKKEKTEGAGRGSSRSTRGAEADKGKEDNRVNGEDAHSAQAEDASMADAGAIGKEEDEEGGNESAADGDIKEEAEAEAEDDDDDDADDDDDDDGEGDDGEGDDGEGDDGEGDDVEGDDVEDDDVEDDDGEAASRPGSSGSGDHLTAAGGTGASHKRSASVLSMASNKSSKRQRK